MTDRLRVVARLRERIHHGVKLGQRRSREVMKPLRAKCKLEGLRSGEVAEPGLRRTPGTRVNSKGFRGFESPPLRQPVPTLETAHSNSPTVAQFPDGTSVKGDPRRPGSLSCNRNSATCRCREIARSPLLHLDSSVLDGFRRMEGDASLFWVA